jgi:hypothetical protein
MHDPERLRVCANDLVPRVDEVAVREQDFAAGVPVAV